MKTRLVIAMLFVLGLGASGYYTHAAPQTNAQPSAKCCGGDPGTPFPSEPSAPEPQAPAPSSPTTPTK